MTKVVGPSKAELDSDLNGIPDAIEGQLFTAIRGLLQARGSEPRLSQAEVDRIKRAMLKNLASASPSEAGRGVTKRLIDFLHSFEQFRANAYKDPGSRNGLPITIGWGSTSDLQGRPIKLGDVWTREYADAKFAQDLARFEIGVNMLLGSAPTTQGQFDALVSFAYNVGLDIDEDTKAEGLGDSTLLRKHLAGDFAGAAAEFAKWNKNDGVVMNGLTRRRAAEAAMYRGE